MQSMVTSFLRHWSMSTELKKATDCGRSCIPNACANILLWETKGMITEFDSTNVSISEQKKKLQSRPREQVCDLQRQRCSVAVLTGD